MNVAPVYSGTGGVYMQAVVARKTVPPGGPQVARVAVIEYGLVA